MNTKYLCTKCGKEIEDTGSYKHGCPNGCFEDGEIGELLNRGNIERVMNTKKDTATARPWKIDDNGDANCYYIATVDGHHICRVECLDESIEDESEADEIANANAALIVRAVNSHEALLEACKKALKRYKNLLRGSEYYEEEQALERAIKQAEGK